MRLRILVLALGTFALGTDGFVIAGILPAVGHDLAIPAAVTGQLITAFALTYAIGAPVLAVLTSDLARKRLLILSLAGFAGANVLAALAPSYGVLMLARMLAACCAALYTPNASAAAVALAPAEARGRALALVTAGLTVATVLGVPLGTWIGTTLSWRATFWLVVVLGVLAAVGVMALFPEIANPPATPLRVRFTLLRQPRILTALSLTVVALAGVFTMYTYIAPLLLGVTHLGGAGISVMLLLFGLAGVAGNALGGQGADRWGAFRTLIPAISIVALVLVLLPFAATSALGAALMLLIWGIAGWTFTPVQQYRLLALAPAQPGIILSLNASAIYLGIGLGAALGGLVVHGGSFVLLGLVAALWQVVALGILFVSARQGAALSARPEALVTAEARVPSPTKEHTAVR
ncbi:MAG TPA: MFS transporter [Ktedonobacterales bacterium]|nr:MFS transporter [Ktedonobacterales bacterium]